MIGLEGADMIETTNMILAELSSYANPKAKLSRLVKKGIYIQIVRELYETDRDVPRHLLAGSIYGPSYISFACALGFYGMIPEAVYAVTSATFEKRKNKKYQTPFGVFLYRDVPFAVFPLGIRLLQEGGAIFIASQNPKRHFAISFISCRRPQTQGNCLHSYLTISAWKRQRFRV